MYLTVSHVSPLFPSFSFCFGTDKIFCWFKGSKLTKSSIQTQKPIVLRQAVYRPFIIVINKDQCSVRGVDLRVDDLIQFLTTYKEKKNA